VPGAIYADNDDGRTSDPQFGMTISRWSSAGKTPPYANHSYHDGKRNQLHVLPSADRQFVNKGHSAGTEEPNFEKGSYFCIPTSLSLYPYKMICTIIFSVLDTVLEASNRIC
jgi:hypothetical protein